MSDHPKDSRMKATLALLRQGQSSPTKQKGAAAGKHPHDCPCHECVARRSVETFAAVREALKYPMPSEYLDQGGPLPRPLPERPRHANEELMSSHALAREAALMSMAAKALPKQKGRKVLHSKSDLWLLLQGVEKTQAEFPEMDDKKALEHYCTEQVSNTSIKTLQNMLCSARNLFGIEGKRGRTTKK